MENEIVTHEDRFEKWLRKRADYAVLKRATRRLMRSAFLAGCNSMLPRDEGGKIRQHG